MQISLDYRPCGGSGRTSCEGALPALPPPLPPPEALCFRQNPFISDGGGGGGGGGGLPLSAKFFCTRGHSQNGPNAREPIQFRMGSVASAHKTPPFPSTNCRPKNLRRLPSLLRSHVRGWISQQWRKSAKRSCQRMHGRRSGRSGGREREREGKNENSKRRRRNNLRPRPSARRR